MIREQDYWARVQQIARCALLEYVDGDAETPTAAVEQVRPSLGPARRADAAWLVELVDERITNEKRAEFAESVRTEVRSA